MYLCPLTLGLLITNNMRKSLNNKLNKLCYFWFHDTASDINIAYRFGLSTKVYYRFLSKKSKVRPY